MPGLYPWQLSRRIEIYHIELKLLLLPVFFSHSASLYHSFSRISRERKRFENDGVDIARTIQYLLSSYWERYEMVLK